MVFIHILTVRIFLKFFLIIIKSINTIFKISQVFSEYLINYWYFLEFFLKV